MISLLNQVSEQQLYIITFYIQVFDFLLIYFGVIFITYPLEINVDCVIHVALICKQEDSTLQVSCENRG